MVFESSARKRGIRPLSELSVRVTKAMQLPSLSRFLCVLMENDVVKWDLLATLHPYLLSVGDSPRVDNYQFPSSGLFSTQRIVAASTAS